MPPLPEGVFGKGHRMPTDPVALVELGARRANRFCDLNGIPRIQVNVVPKEDWWVGACAYWRKQTCFICLPECARPCTEASPRAWSWPGYCTDRTPYGVVCHELGHHCDEWAGVRKSGYGSEYGVGVMRRSGEAPLTSYCPNPWEWFAEIFRLFVTNPPLLQSVRPKAYKILLEKFRPLPSSDWRVNLGSNVPPKVLKAAVNKGAK